MRGDVVELDCHSLPTERERERQRKTKIESERERVRERKRETELLVIWNGSRWLITDRSFPVLAGFEKLRMILEANVVLSHVTIWEM